MTRDEMMRRISYSEFIEWMILENIEPFGERGDYLRAGIIAATIANVNRGKDQPAYSPLDFMPVIKEPEPAQTAEEISAMMRMIQLAQEAQERR